MLLNINIITYKKYFLEKISHKGQTQRAQGVPAPRAAWGWQLVTPAVAWLCFARTPQNLPLGSYCLLVPSKYQRDTLRNVGTVKRSATQWHLSGTSPCPQAAQSCPAGLQEPSALTSPWAGHSPTAAFHRGCVWLQGKTGGGPQKVLQQLSLRSRRGEGALLLIGRDTSSSQAD